MASINSQGNVIARCPGCDGAKSTFEYLVDGQELGSTTRVYQSSPSDDPVTVRFQIFRCAGCGRGAMGTIKMMNLGRGYPRDVWELLDFYPEAKERLPLPKMVPVGIVNEFREAEMCAEAKCPRAAAALFRSVLDKTLRANGYKTAERQSLKAQIDDAAKDGVITAARQKRAHEEVRVLGNDVLHDEWAPVNPEDVEAAHKYSQRVLEDFYDDRESVEKLLTAAGRKFQGQPEKKK